jgi:O-succinylbenzoate synthase
LSAAWAEITPPEANAPAPRAVPDYLPVAALLPAGRAALTAIAPKADAGFRIFKWKVAVADPADELAMLDDLCAALPAGAKVRLDANGGWDRRGAERWLDRAADYPIDFIEQPIAPFARGAEDILLGLANDYPTPVALDESLGGAADLIHWLDAGWKGVFVIKPALLGDAAAALGRLAAAKSAVVFSSALETAVGARSGLQTAFRWPGEARALGFGVWPLFADPRCDGPAATPFVRWLDVAAIDPEALWNVLS